MASLPWVEFPPWVQSMEKVKVQYIEENPGTVQSVFVPKFLCFYRNLRSACSNYWPNYRPMLFMFTKWHYPRAWNKHKKLIQESYVGEVWRTLGWTLEFPKYILLSSSMTQMFPNTKADSNFSQNPRLCTFSTAPHVEYECKRSMRSRTSMRYFFRFGQTNILLLL